MPAQHDDSATPGLVPLPEDAPVELPDLPEMVIIDTPERMKALGDQVRVEITHIIQFQPATAKQIAEKLGLSPGAVGHHLHVLERAGLVQIVALRLVRGTVAKYYARTGKMYGFPAVEASAPEDMPTLRMITSARDEVHAAVQQGDPADWCSGWFPHARLSEERMIYYTERLDTLVQEFLHEPPDPHGKVQGLSIVLFTAPPAMQTDDPDDTEPEA
jgi:DNA-binding transcriptional ArsR family regulator